MKSRLEALLSECFYRDRKRCRLVPARLHTALALLEKLREQESLSLEDHLASPSSSGLRSHETFAKEALARLNLQGTVKVHGRRSNELRNWGPKLLVILGGAGFAESNLSRRTELIDQAQAFFALHVRAIAEQEPLTAHVRHRTAEAVIREVLDQAEDKGKAGDVAQYLVGAKLEIRFNIELPLNAANKRDRRSRSDSEDRLGDFEIDGTVFEMALGLPDEKHITQIADALEESDEVWLITRKDRLITWENELRENFDEAERRRVVITSVDSFIGQNIAELGKFSVAEMASQFKALFEHYNARWVAKLGTPGIKIDFRR